MLIKLTILLNKQEVLGEALEFKNDFWCVRTSSDRNYIPLYEFKCDANLTTFLKDELFDKAD